VSGNYTHSSSIILPGNFLSVSLFCILSYMRWNPITEQLLGHFREDSRGYQILTAIFDNHWNEIVDFTQNHQLPIPTHYLGQGMMGVVLRADRQIVKILTNIFSDQSIEDDLSFVKYFSNHYLPGFTEVDAVLTLRVGYWYGPFLERLRQEARGAQADARSLSKAPPSSWQFALGQELAEAWKEKLQTYPGKKELTYLIWLEQVDASGRDALQFLSQNNSLREIEAQFQLITHYPFYATSLFEVDQHQLTNIGQFISWEKYDGIKAKLYDYLHLAHKKAPLFRELITSLIILLKKDIIISDLKVDNLGVKWINKVPKPLFFDAMLHPLNP